jgi:hypothetical protein
VTAGLSAVNLANAILNLFRNTTFTGIATPFIQLHTADPGASGTTAVSAGSATRNAVTWNAASAASMTLATLSAWTNGGTSETITHVSIWSAASAGTFYWSMPLTASQSWASTNTLTINTFTLNFTPIAA